jgi:hypothetical protein
MTYRNRTEKRIEPMKLTVICREEGYTDNVLIYTVDVTNPQDQAEVQNAIHKERERDLGKGEVNAMEALFAFEGDVPTHADWRD